MSLLSEAWAMKDSVTVPAKSKLAKVGRRPAVWRSEDYRRLVASVPCVYAGCGKASQAAHRNEGKAMAAKTPDGMLFAACPVHHDQADQGNKVSKAERRAYEDAMIVKTWAWLIANGKIGVVE